MKRQRQRAQAGNHGAQPFEATAGVRGGRWARLGGAKERSTREGEAGERENGANVWVIAARGSPEAPTAGSNPASLTARPSAAAR